MKKSSRNLDRVQRWMHSVITHPDGIGAGIDSEGAQAEIDITQDAVEDVIKPSETQSSLERLQVYGNAYYARLIECLQDEFPTLMYALDENAFIGFAMEYLQVYPSQSYTLAELGKNFPKFLEETRPDKEEQDSEDSSPDWVDLMIDIARLERTYSEVFDGEGVEEKPLLQPEDFANIPPEQIGEIKLQPVPCLRLMTFSFSVHDYATAVRQEESPDYPQAEPTWLAITRRDYIVRRVSISYDQYIVLKCLQKGMTLAESIGQAVDATKTSMEEFASLLQEWFQKWTAAGYFEKVILPE